MFSVLNLLLFQVMDGYQAIDLYAYHAWRHWQGTLSGKCGITFEEDRCGESVRSSPSSVHIAGLDRRMLRGSERDSLKGGRANTVVVAMAGG